MKTYPRYEALDNLVLGFLAFSAVAGTVLAIVLLARSYAGRDYDPTPWNCTRTRHHVVCAVPDGGSR